MIWRHFKYEHVNAMVTLTSSHNIPCNRYCHSVLSYLVPSRFLSMKPSHLFYFCGLLLGNTQGVRFRVVQELNCLSWNSVQVDFEKSSNLGLRRIRCWLSAIFLVVTSWNVAKLGSCVHCLVLRIKQDRICQWLSGCCFSSGYGVVHCWIDPTSLSLWIPGIITNHRCVVW